MKNVIRKRIEELPNINEDIALEMPVLDKEVYKSRIKRLCEAGKEYEYFVIYGDREHFSNIEYFTGFDPRFEEALLVISREEKVTLIVGDEGEGYAAKINYDIRLEVYPVLGLPGQPSMHDVRLSDILAGTGISPQNKIGVMGWKCFYSSDFEDEKKVFDLPYFIMQSLLEIVPLENLYSVNDLMIANEYGLRHNLEAEELVMCEIYGTKSSRNVYRVLENLEEGMDEVTASSYFRINGEPLVAHPNVNFGDNNYYGLASCSPYKKLVHGELVGVGMSYRRSLCHKESFYIKDESEESEKLREFYNTYFRALTSWYEALRIDATGGEVYESVEKITGNLTEFGIGLNPGHLIHTEEWSNSPFMKNCKDRLHSGMAVQCDFTASRKELGLAVHAEDGVILADEEMRKAIWEIAPKSYARMMNRRKFMIETLGIHIAPEVLPTSDMPGVIFPYLGNLSIVIANEGD